MPSAVSTVGIYDADWLLLPEFERMLDLMVSSPGGITGVRFFGLLSSGTPELLKPQSGGTVWLQPDAEPDFTVPFATLEALTTRGLVPFVALGFFPPAIAPSPITPPSSFERWRRLIATFLEELAADARFGPEAIKSWRFEAWNEPNEGRFWSGTFEQYLELYRATSDAVRDTGLSVRLGGPAMAYKPESEREDGPETMRRFLEFLRDHDEVQCDFVSYHRKGTVDRSAPDPRRLWDASAEVERLIWEIVPDRAPDLEIINNEADEKIGFESPYPPRMDAFMASWLSTLITMAANRSATENAPGPVHSFFPDNANLQLMQEPFDGRRSIYVPISNDDRTRLVKTPGAIWYDLLPLLSGTLLAIDDESDAAFPHGDLHLLAVRSEVSCTILATWFPVGDEDASLGSPLEVLLTDCPWAEVNVIEYRIDATHSNSYTAAGGGPDNPDPSPASMDVQAVQIAQELTFERASDSPVAVMDGALRLSLSLEPFATVCFWITPFDPGPIDVPKNVALQRHDAEAVLSWDAVDHPQLLGYHVERVASDGSSTPLTNTPIRPTLITDELHPTPVTYRVCAVSASGARSGWTTMTESL